jgi:RHS repeat-associated protein
VAFTRKTNTGEITKYYSLGGERVAMSKASTRYYLLTDHLSGTTRVLNDIGQEIATQKYWPYGATRATTGTLPTDKLFTGQQQEPGDVLNLYDYGARFYSTTFGRFINADPLTVDGYRYA